MATVTARWPRPHQADPMAVARIAAPKNLDHPATSIKAEDPLALAHLQPASIAQADDHDSPC